MIFALRTVGSIYLLIATTAFLLLPTCPCEIMALFGVDLHAHEEAPEEVAFEATFENPFFLHCFCGDGPPKCADLLESSESGAADSEESTLLSYETGGHAAAELHWRKDHPPPEIAGASIRGRELSGVYLI